MTNIVRNPEDEIINYIDAYEIQQAEVPTDMLTTKQRRFNPLTNENDLLMRMPNGGYVKVGSEPLAMTEAPKQPELPAADELPTGGLGPQVESLQLYVQNNLGGKYDMKDLEAAGYSPEVIKAAGLDVQPEPMFAPKPQEDPENPEPLSEQETADIIASGQPIITVNPSLRDKASQSFVNFLYETAIEGLKDDLREQGLGQGEIDRMVAEQQDDLFKNAEIYSNALFGTGPTGMEVGAADFLTAGIMDIEEGRRLFNQQRPENNGSLGGRAVGALIMAAGLAEATGVGYAFGKLLKRGAKALEPTLVRMGDEVEQPASQEPPKLSAEERRRQANIQRFGYDPNEAPDTSYRMEHQPRGPEDGEGIRLDDLTKNISGEQAGYPDDFYTSQGMRLYAQGPSFEGDEFGLANQESYEVIASVKGNPDAEVTIYRAVPDEDAITTINPGDFVTLSPTYAKLHGASGYGRSGDEAGKVLEQKVKVRDIYWDGNDVNEFGYFPEEE